MAYVAGNKARIYVDSTNVGQFMNNVSVSRNAEYRGYLDLRGL